MPNSGEPTVLVVIPARYASTRFPGKPLASISGKPMIQHVLERVRLASLPSRVIVATEDDEVKILANDMPIAAGQVVVNGNRIAVEVKRMLPRAPDKRDG